MPGPRLETKRTKGTEEVKTPIRLADGELSIFDTFKNTNPERIIEEYGQTRFHFS